MRLGTPGETLDTMQPADADADTDADACDAVVAGAPGEPRGERRIGLKIHHRGCCSVSDAADARLVAAELDIPLYVCNFKKDFGRIIDYFAGEYASGRTPNPCVRCNDWLKFGKLHDYARQIGASAVASGHYARVEPGPDGPELRRAVDHAKDQSYVLFGAPRQRLAEMILPIGRYPKPEVRDMARRFGLPVFDKPDSQEICFVPDDDYASLVERRRGDAHESALTGGDILTTSGKVVGRHLGQHRYTIGQRRGVGVAMGRPIYVVGKDPAANTITIGDKEDLLTSSCVAGEANWLIDVPDDPHRWLACHARYRYAGAAVPARVRPLAGASSDTPSGRRGRFELRFETPQEAVAPGQALVLYRGDRVLGGGWIESSRPVTPDNHA
jgi:tRNA-specific 2-thiouridylase